MKAKHIGKKIRALFMQEREKLYLCARIFNIEQIWDYSINYSLARKKRRSIRA